MGKGHLLKGGDVGMGGHHELSSVGQPHQHDPLFDSHQLCPLVQLYEVVVVLPS